MEIRGDKKPRTYDGRSRTGVCVDANATRRGMGWDREIHDSFVFFFNYKAQIKLRKNEHILLLPTENISYPIPYAECIGITS